MPTLYDEDVVLWSEQQARLLRETVPIRRNEPIDWENIVEEIESLGISQVTEVHSRLARIVEHMLKLQFSPAQQPRRGWIETIGEQRSELLRALARSPSLRPRLDEFLQEIAPHTATMTARVLTAWGETGAAEAVREHGGRYTLDEVLESFPAGDADPAPRLGRRSRRR